MNDVVDLIGVLTMRDRQAVVPDDLERHRTHLRDTLFHPFLVTPIAHERPPKGEPQLHKDDDLTASHEQVCSTASRSGPKAHRSGLALPRFTYISKLYLWVCS